MRITDLLKKQGIEIGASVKDKPDAIEKVVALHEKCGNLKDRKAYKEGILKREEMGTTAIGMEIAIPHAKSEAVKAPALTAITVPAGVDYGSPDGEACKLIFMIAATTDGDVHLEVLARMMQMLMDMDFTAKLKAAKNADEFLKLIDEKETEKFPEESKKGEPKEAAKAAPAKAEKDGRIRVLARQAVVRRHQDRAELHDQRERTCGKYILGRAGLVAPAVDPQHAGHLFLPALQRTEDQQTDRMMADRDLSPLGQKQMLCHLPYLRRKSAFPAPAAARGSSPRSAGTRPPRRRK